MNPIDMRSAVLLAMTRSDSEGRTLLERVELFIARLIELDYQLVPIETLVGRVPPYLWDQESSRENEGDIIEGIGVVNEHDVKFVGPRHDLYPLLRKAYPNVPFTPLRPPEVNDQ